MAYSTEKKDEVVKDALEMGIRPAARKHSIATSTVDKWVAKSNPVAASPVRNTDQGEQNLAWKFLEVAERLLDDLTSLDPKDQQASSAAIDKLVAQYLHLTGKPTSKTSHVYEGITEDDIDALYDELFEEEESDEDDADEEFEG